ncbi:hypothetical protein KGP36_02825 [Patescibacteria group bacterium]|nr:hypothetical protein [Patescibacteria group bacterium]
MSKTEKRPITDDEYYALQLLDGVGMPSACWDKRFRRDVLSPARNTKLLSEKAIAQMWRLFIRYRRQINTTDKPHLMKIAEEKAAPDFRKQQAALNEQARINEMKERYAETFK